MDAAKLSNGDRSLQATHDGASASDEGALEVRYRLPIEGFPQALYRGSYGFHHGTLTIDGSACLNASGPQLRQGVHASYRSHDIEIRVGGTGDDEQLMLRVDGRAALAENELTAPSARSTWIHGFIGLGASAAGFAAGYLYLHKAAMMANPWASKMGYHTAAWHALLVVTLFPSSVWGQRVGIRAVQVISFVFLLIHLGIAVANAAWPDAGSSSDGWLAALNALSGMLFLASVVYGQRAYRDMDPLAPWRARLASSPSGAPARPPTLAG